MQDRLTASLLSCDCNHDVFHVHISWLFSFLSFRWLFYGTVNACLSAGGPKLAVADGEMLRRKALRIVEEEILPCYFSAIKLYSTLLRVQKTTEESPTTRHHVTNNAVLLGKGCCPKVEALNQIKLPRKGYLCESSHSKGQMYLELLYKLFGHRFCINLCVMLKVTEGLIVDQCNAFKVNWPFLPLSLITSSPGTYLLFMNWRCHMCKCLLIFYFSMVMVECGNYYRAGNFN